MIYYLSVNVEKPFLFFCIIVYVVSAVFFSWVSLQTGNGPNLWSPFCHLPFLSPSWRLTLSSYHQPLPNLHISCHFYFLLYFTSFCSLIGWMFSAWHHHCLREHCSPGLRSRCPYIYKYDSLSTAAVNTMTAAFKENNWVIECLTHFLNVHLCDAFSYSSPIFGNC